MKTYPITLQGQDYTICLRSYSVEINGTRYKIRSLPARKLLFLTMEVDLPISGAHVMLVSGLWSMELSMLRPEASIISSFTFCLAFRQP